MLQRGSSIKIYMEHTAEPPPNLRGTVDRRDGLTTSSFYLSYCWFLPVFQISQISWCWVQARDDLPKNPERGALVLLCFKFFRFSSENVTNWIPNSRNSELELNSLNSPQRTLREFQTTLMMTKQVLLKPQQLRTALLRRSPLLLPNLGSIQTGTMLEGGQHAWARQFVANNWRCRILI